MLCEHGNIAPCIECVVRPLQVECQRLQADRRRLQADRRRLQADRRRLQAEREELRKDAEFGRSVLSKREPGKVYGCHCDLEEGMEPDGCVIDEGSPHQCVYAKHISTKEQCKYWQEVTS